jgi:LysM repeat protein
VNRRQIALIIILNALISLVVALLVVWIVDVRRPDAEELAALAGVAVVGNNGSASGVQLPPTATGAAPTSSAPAAPETTPVPAADEPTVQTGGEPEYYTVQAGDTLSGIATKLGVTMQELVDANGLNDANNIFSGQRLLVPSGVAPPTATPPQVFGTTGLKIRTVAGAGLLPNEYVEIINDTDQVFSLQGWKLQQGGGGPEYSFGDVQIFPGGSVRLYSTAGNDSTIARYWGQSSAIWSSGSVAILINAQGERVAEYTVP